MMALQKNLKRFDLKLKVRFFVLSKMFFIEELSTSPKQAVSKLLGKDKKLIDNWRPISPANADVS